jgi:hypothetical protein
MSKNYGKKILEKAYKPSGFKKNNNLKNSFKNDLNINIENDLNDDLKTNLENNLLKDKNEKFILSFHEFLVYAVLKELEGKPTNCNLIAKELKVLKGTLNDCKCKLERKGLIKTLNSYIRIGRARGFSAVVIVPETMVVTTGNIKKIKNKLKKFKKENVFLTNNVKLSSLL